MYKKGVYGYHYSYYKIRVVLIILDNVMVSAFLLVFSSHLRAEPSPFAQPFPQTALSPDRTSALADTFVLSPRILLLRTL